MTSNTPARRRPDRRDMLIPKPTGKRRVNFLPILPNEQLRFVTGKLMPLERLAMREICEDGDVFQMAGRTWLLAPVSRHTIDALAAFEADAEDREIEQDDEDNADRENDLSDLEPDDADDHRFKPDDDPVSDHRRAVIAANLSTPPRGG